MKEILKYDERLVAFIDILGFKEIVKQSEKDSSRIELIYSVLSYLKNWEVPKKWNLKFVEIEEDAQKKGIERFDIRNKTNSTSFSDSIVVSVKVENDINEVASTLIVNLAYIGAILFEQGILFRGGLTIGNIIHDEHGTVFGQGLIDACKLERNNANYPRIILSDKLIGCLNYPINSKKDRYPYHQYINRFEDGCVGFHQMQYYQVIERWEEMTIEELTENLENVRKVIINGLDESFEKQDVYDKFKWLKNQYHKLIIHSDFDFEIKSDENVKIKIRDLNEGITGQNIHFTYTDDFYKMIRNN